MLTVALLDDLVPEPLHMWDAAVLERLRSEGKGETLFFEFKELFDVKDVEKTVCAFANRLGGFLLFGTTAKSTDNSIDLYPGLDPGVDWIRRVSDGVVGHVSPLPTWNTIQVGSPDVKGRLIVITRVEASDSTPHILARNGRIYLRNPAGSDPVTDKATIDALIARGTGGTGVARRRADEIHGASPAADLLMVPPGDPFLVQIAAVPSPPLGDDALADLLSTSGRASAGGVFSHPAVRGMKPIEHREDRVHLVGGFQVAARYTDGSIFLRFASSDSYLGVGPFSRLVKGVLKACAYQVPPAHQVLLDVRVVSAQARRLDEDGTGRLASVRPLGVELWQWTELTGTSDAAADRTSGAIGSRLWRAVGDSRGLTS